MNFNYLDTEKGGLMPARSILSKQGIMLQEAKDFINMNIEQPELILNAAFNHAVTTSMLNEITGYSIDEINAYFYSKTDNYYPSDLDAIGKLVNSDLGSLEILVDFNSNTGILSTLSLQEKVRSSVNPSVYESFIEPIFPFQKNDGYIYDPEELGVKHLSNVAATNGNIESLFYGTLINIFLRLDSTERDQIKHFSGDKNSEEYHTLLMSSLNTIPSTTWTDEALANLVVEDAVRIVNDFPTSDFIGILDDSFLGLSAL